MNKVVNVLCNTPIYVGLGILHVAVAVKFVANKCFDLSFALHMKAGTEVGQKISELTKQAKEIVETLKAAAAAQNGEDNRLARAVRQQPLPNGVFQIGKKTTTDN